MKKYLQIAILTFVIIGFSSFTIHKFYVSIYQINYVTEKKMLQITSRIFVDDLNKMLSEKYKTKVNLGEKEESIQDVEVMKKYIFENFKITVNGKPKTIHFANKEMEGNVLICYYNVKEIPKIKTLEIVNSVLLDLNDEQQNIVHTTVLGNKKSFLFSGTNAKGLLKN
ncbi:hypothetical protein EQG63_01655 [Flavobacterium amnicola]|jgi:hypothetical protein|uniref:Peptidase E n=1 Tax=Flavobacterium amnicola TaxID=2506422 RepID=A0A4Q1K658_9FLAO|nr:DUF6702 family protein [Flavobacterium amnicola]RXR20664.1 hypothetical protein EQG63_01655 [Flavobacterium amnicola]